MTSERACDAAASAAIVAPPVHLARSPSVGSPPSSLARSLPYSTSVSDALAVGCDCGCVKRCAFVEERRLQCIAPVGGRTEAVLLPSGSSSSLRDALLPTPCRRLSRWPPMAQVRGDDACQAVARRHTRGKLNLVETSPALPRDTYIPCVTPSPSRELDDLPDSVGRAAPFAADAAATESMRA